LAESKKKGRTSKAEAERKRKEEEQTKLLEKRQQRYAWTFFILGIVFTLLGFVEGQNVWRTLHGWAFGLFGLLTYIIGPTMLYLCVVFALGKTTPVPKVLKAFFLILSVSGAFYLFGENEPGNFFADIAELFMLGTQKTSGGALSALFGWTLQVLCGQVAAKVLIVVMILVAAMLITGKTIIDIINAIKGWIETAREKRKLEKEMAQRTAEFELPPAVTEKDAKFDIDVTLDQRSGTSASIDIPLEEIKTSAKKSKSRDVSPASAIDIPLGPPPDKKSAIDVDIPDIWNSGRKKPTGPAAKITDQVFEHGDMISNTFADFGSPEFEELIARESSKKEDRASSADTRPKPRGEYKFPPLSMLDKPQNPSKKDISDELRSNARALVETLESFGVKTRVVDISRGPTVTRYELQPEVGVRLSKIVNLSDDLALNLAAMGVRIEAPIPGKAAVGIEVPNKETAIVKLRAVLESNEYRSAASPLTISLGMDLSGAIKVGDISKMPHLMIAGSTGMGKSVFINSMIISLVYKSSPDDVKLILIDPKMVEFSIYKGLPHLPVPVVTEAGKAAGALETALAEMLRRYKLFADNAVRNIDEYNAMVERNYPPGYEFDDEEEVVEKKPRWVIIIDELADLMMTAPREVENAICRIAQMGRAAGIHLVVATQRPSVDVITGTIKNNIPTRVAFRVSSQIDSRTILDGGGAEKLIGRGDMLYQPVGQPKPARIQGCFVSEEEVSNVVAFIKKNSAEQYNEELVREIEQNAVIEKGKDAAGGADPMLEAAIEAVVETGKASTSFLQRRLGLGYARAARIMDEMENMGIIGPADGSKPRTVNMTRQQWHERMMNN